jgi:hypothetical protein
MAVTPQEAPKRSKLAEVGSGLAQGVKGLARGLAEGLAENTKAGRILIDPFIETQSERRMRERDERQERSANRAEELAGISERRALLSEENAARVARQSEQTMTRQAEEHSMAMMRMADTTAKQRGKDELIRGGVPAEEADDYLAYMPTTMAIDAAIGLFANGKEDEARKYVAMKGIPVVKNKAGVEVFQLPDGQQVPVSMENVVKVRDAVAAGEMREALTRRRHKYMGQTAGMRYGQQGIDRAVAAGAKFDDATRQVSKIVDGFKNDQSAMAKQAFIETLDEMERATAPAQLQQLQQDAIAFFGASGLGTLLEPALGTGLQDTFFHLKGDVPGVGRAGTTATIKQVKDYISKTSPMARAIDAAVDTMTTGARPAVLKQARAVAEAAGLAGQDFTLPQGVDFSPDELTVLEADYQKGKMKAAAAKTTQEGKELTNEQKAAKLAEARGKSQDPGEFLDEFEGTVRSLEGK